MINELEKETNSICKILNSIINAVVLTDCNGKIIYFNTSFLKMFKYKNNDNVIGKSVHELIADGDVKSISDLQMKIKDNVTGVDNLLVYSEDKSLFSVEVKISDLTDFQENIIGKIICFKDISDYKKLENNLNEKTAELVRLSKQKDDFIWQLGHDLKTPLSPIITLLPILEKKEQDSEVKELVKVVIENLNIIKNRIDRILDFAQIQSFGTKFNFENLSLNNIVNSTIEKNFDLIRKNNLSVYNEIDENIIVKADKIKLIEVFYNLLSNSVKYSPKGSKITIFAMEENNMVTVSFEDTGVGMTKEEIKHVFDEFYKTDESRHDLKSSGLGLSICKKIIEKHGGEIYAISLGEGMGVTFYFSLQKAEKK